MRSCSRPMIGRFNSQVPIRQILCVDYAWATDIQSTIHSTCVVESPVDAEQTIFDGESSGSVFPSAQNPTDGV